MRASSVYVYTGGANSFHAFHYLVSSTIPLLRSFFPPLGPISNITFYNFQ